MEVTARDLAKYRLELAEEKLDVAVKLLDDKAWRDAASRVYYAMFHAVRALLATKRLDSRKHSGVISLFNQHFVKPGLVSRDLGRILMTAKDFRERGDYDEFAHFGRNGTDNGGERLPLGGRDQRHLGQSVGGSGG